MLRIVSLNKILCCINSLSLIISYLTPGPRGAGKEGLVPKNSLLPHRPALFKSWTQTTRHKMAAFQPGLNDFQTLICNKLGHKATETLQQVYF